MVSRGRNHCRIIGAKRRRRNKKLHPFLRASGFHFLSQARVCRHPSGNHDPVTPQRRCRHKSFCHQDIHHRFLKACNDIPYLLVGKRPLMILDMTQDRGFDPAEAEVQRVPGHQGAREGYGLRIALAGQPVDDHAARISQPQQLCHLVKCLARRVVPGLSQRQVFPDARHLIDAGMSA